jgi:hydroxymethylglutaryl-CoA reductase (NADPH)
MSRERKSPAPSATAGAQPDGIAATPEAAARIELVPRLDDQGYQPEQVAERRAWAERVTGCALPHVAAGSIPTTEMRGNIENPIGSVQMPLGLAGPLRIRGEHADGTFYVPLATTEGALVRSYERGMVALTRAGGVTTRIHADENRIAPIFTFDDVAGAAGLQAFLDENFQAIRTAAESTTRHGKLLRLVPHPVGHQVIVTFCYATGDAQGMNMIARATEVACAWMRERCGARDFALFSGYGSEKRASGALLAGGKGKKVTAGVRLPRAITSSYLHVEPAQLVDLWKRTVVGHLQAGALGYNGQYANGLAAIFIACGQDVANVANCAVGITDFSLTADGDLYASVTLPSLSVATVGGGTALATSRECLALLGCVGNGKAGKLAEIVAATLLAGEISIGAAIASGEFVAAHEALGRNRPEADDGPSGA